MYFEEHISGPYPVGLHVKTDSVTCFLFGEQKTVLPSDLFGCFKCQGLLVTSIWVIKGPLV